MPKKILQVRPLTRAYQPQYPSFQDPNPLDYPETRPYPFRQKMIDALSKAGFAGALLLSPLTTNAQTTDTPSTGNPFPLAATNLPYTPISFGTGQPSRLAQEDVVDLIYQVFIEEGLQPARDTIISGDDFRLTANAYDPSCNIGFVWLDYSNYGAGTQRISPYHWNPGVVFTQADQEAHLRKRLEAQYEYYLRDQDQYLNDLVHPSYQNSIHDRELQAEFRERLPRLKGEKQREYFVQRLAKHRVRSEQARAQQKERLVAYADLLQSIIDRVENPLSQYALLNRSEFIRRFFRTENSEVIRLLQGDLQRISAIKATGAWRAELEELIGTTALDNHLRYFQQHPEIEEAFTAVFAAKTKTERQEKRALLEELIDAQEVSMTELEVLEEQATKGESYVAPLARLDNRMAYRGSMAYSPDTQARLDAITRAIRTTSEPSKRQALQQEYKQVQQEELLTWKEREELAKLQALRQLEEDVRNYIRWARTQQGY